MASGSLRLTEIWEIFDMIRLFHSKSDEENIRPREPKEIVTGIQAEYIYSTAG